MSKGAPKSRELSVVLSATEVSPIFTVSKKKIVVLLKKYIFKEVNVYDYANSFCNDRKKGCGSGISVLLLIYINIVYFPGQVIYNYIG